MSLPTTVQEAGSPLIIERSTAAEPAKPARRPQPYRGEGVLDASPPAGRCDQSNAEHGAELLQWMHLVGAGVGIATFCGYDAADRFLVRCEGGLAPTLATSTLALRDSDIGCPVIIGYERGDTARPVVIGRPQQRPRDDGGTVRLDGEKLLLQAEREIEFRCGEASIVLTRAGKVLIKGTYVLSRSKGANRIKGAYVDIN